MKLNNKLLLLFITLLGSTAIYILLFYNTDTPSPSTQNITNALPEVIVHDAEINQYLNDSMAWKITAKKTNYFQNIQKILCEDTNCTLFKDSEILGQVHAILTDIDKKTKNVFMHHGVTGKTNDFKLVTDELYYDNKSNTISSTTPILISSDEFTLSAENCNIEIETQNIKFSENVRCEINLQSLGIQQRH